MDINPTTVEQLAREYSRAYAANNVSDNAAIFEQLTILEEEQLDLLNEINVRVSNRLNRTVGYLKNLVYRSLNAIGTLRSVPYIPSVRNARLSCQNNALNRIANLQLDIFLLLDKLTGAYADYAELINLENRKQALIAGIL